MNKAEKFIQDYTSNCYNYNSYAQDPIPWLTPDQARRAVEIAREEIYEWLRKNHEEYQYKAPYNYFDIEQCIDDLKQAIKDEQGNKKSERKILVRTKQY